MFGYRDAQAQEDVLSTVVFVEVLKPDGAPDIGTAFHIGKGYFVTAKHVIEGNRILKIGQEDMSAKTEILPSGDARRSTTHPGFEVLGDNLSWFGHPECDLAIIQVKGDVGQRGPADGLAPAMELADHADVLSAGELLTRSVQVFGFPRIPMSFDRIPPLVVVPGVISAVMQNHGDRRRHFILSAMARGGFSGGPVFLMENVTVRTSAERLRANSSTAIGVVVWSRRAERAGEDLEPGFVDAISIENVYQIIDLYRLPLKLR